MPKRDAGPFSIIGERLREAMDPVAREALPPEIKILLDKLDAAEASPPGTAGKPIPENGKNT